MKLLAKTAGAVISQVFIQKRERPDYRYYLGQGKLYEIKVVVEQEKPELILIDNPISSSQQRNIEEVLGVKVIDRTGLILDIFAKHAHSHEGLLQVELAQLNYLLPRLSGKGISLSRLAGGIGTRGPGETKLEVDRRRIRERISRLKREMKKIKRVRTTQQAQRKRKGIPTVSLIGYTNAGKSTLLNQLTLGKVETANKLFATLDPTSRRMRSRGRSEIIITDTVGFINNLPHQLISAFHATLEEVVDSDLLLHVVDLSDREVQNQIEAVFKVLEEIDAITKPLITVFNKTDQSYDINLDFTHKYHPKAFISALNGEGIEVLKDLISLELTPHSRSNARKIFH